ncbi:MAG: cell division protein ZapD [Idiomarinaceae bacterium]|nr:cell division protein ZapD [Idiomarinaceae bacterium]HAD48921.1 cell division protein ZapD [Idiomarina sp.]
MSSEQQSSSVYEYPLQERFRTYLRLEHSFAELNNALALAEHAPLAFFNTLFATQELIERNDIKTELAKDLELQRATMERWQNHPQIDQNALQGALQSITMASDNLQYIGRALRQLKDDRFLASIRSRLIQPGITGLFELPQLQRWLSQPLALQQQHWQHWHEAVQPLAAAIQLQLELTRQQGEFDTVVARNGFWQESCDPLALLRIRMPPDSPYYPIVSGHRQRFTLRFMAIPTSTDADAANEDITFELARSPLLSTTTS